MGYTGEKGAILVLDWAVLGEWGLYVTVVGCSGGMGSCWDSDGIYWRNGGYVGAGLDHTGKMGVTLGLWWDILGEWGSNWGCGDGRMGITLGLGWVCWRPWGNSTGKNWDTVDPVTGGDLAVLGRGHCGAQRGLGCPGHWFNWL